VENKEVPPGQRELLKNYPFPFFCLMVLHFLHGPFNVAARQAPFGQLRTQAFKWWLAVQAILLAKLD
jgi:hypothetical protein